MIRKYISLLLLALLLCSAAAGCAPDAPQTVVQESTPTPTLEPTPAPTPTPVPTPYIAPTPEPPPLIAHAGGAVYGFRLTNSLEALDTAYANGFRYIEVDIECTADGEYVLLHDWSSMAQRMLFESGSRTLANFQSAETFMDLTLLDLGELLAWLDTHRDCFIITDAKCGNEPFLTALREQAGELAAHFIPQAYSYDEYAAALSAGFETVILTLYRMETVDEPELLRFAETQCPWAITIPEGKLTEPLLQSLAAHSVCVYTHTVNDLSCYEQWREHGLHGIYTDYFYPAKWPY